MAWEALEHTSDLQLQIRGQSEEKLFVDAAQAVLAQIVESVGVRSEIKKSISILSETPEERFLDWLREILFFATSKGFLPKDVAKIRLFKKKGQYCLKAILSGEMIVLERHKLLHEIKTVTYQDFQYEKKGDLWQARVVLDV